jgi:dolichyl-phosphate-mannose--protein O-mannosyl transferase
VYGNADKNCVGDACPVEAITALGNPVIWWLGVAGLAMVLYGAVFWADRRAWAILAGYAGGYLPWFAYLGRTVFTFYTIAFTPFVVLALVYGLGILVGPSKVSPARKRRGVIIAGTVVVLALAAAAYFWPIWTGETITRGYWYSHMWLGNHWI